MSAKRLSWHKHRSNSMTLTGRPKVAIEWRAWAPQLDPDAKLPPYYVIARVDGEYLIELVNCKTCGGERTEISTETLLAVAKIRVNTDYCDRLKELTTTTT